MRVQLPLKLSEWVERALTNIENVAEDYVNQPETAASFATNIKVKAKCQTPSVTPLEKFVSIYTLLATLTQQYQTESESESDLNRDFSCFYKNLVKPFFTQWQTMLLNSQLLSAVVETQADIYFDLFDVKAEGLEKVPSIKERFISTIIRFIKTHPSRTEIARKLSELFKREEARKALFTYRSKHDTSLLHYLAQRKILGAYWQAIKLGADQTVLNNKQQTPAKLMFSGQNSLTPLGANSNLDEYRDALIYDRQLGSGGQADVFRMTDENSDMHEVALKVFYHAEDEHAQTELDMLSHLSSSDCVPKLLGVWHLGPYRGIVMEYVPGGDLRWLIANDKVKLESDLQQEITQSLVKAIDFIHRQSIIHVDLKSENILMVYSENDRCQIKLTDFGHACSQNTTNDFTVQTPGTAEYSPPEMLEFLVHNKYDKNNYQTDITIRANDAYKIDIFGLGVILWELTSRNFPWMEVIRQHPGDRIAQTTEVYKRVGQGKERLAFSEHYQTQPVAKLVSQMWCQSPADRPTIEEVKEKVEHTNLFSPTPS